MPNEDNNFIGTTQNSSSSAERRPSENAAHFSNDYQQQPSPSSYLILSPSNPVRTFAISFLTHWIYSTVIIVTICAFVISSSYHNFLCKEVQEFGDSNEPAVQKEFTVVLWTRGVLFIVILFEILIKSFARGFLVGSLSYLRIAWDWLDVISLVLVFVSTICPWKGVESLAAAIVLLKLIPIHPGSINAFISLCSCAKKLIPVLVYEIIIVWLYGAVIFTLFIKHQQDNFENGNSVGDATFTKTNGSASGSVENGDITRESPITAFVDGAYLAPSTSKKSENSSFGLSVECLPTNLRSLSGSLIQASQMLTLGFSQSDLTSPILWGNLSNLNQLESLCQYEIYTLSIVETLVIISGTLPLITMTFAALFDFFQMETNGTAKPYIFHHHDHDDNENETEQESQTSSYQYQQRRRLGSGISGRSNISHSQNYRDEGSSCLSSLYKQLANILCDCDYYFCCLANIQRRLNPCATRLLNSKRFKVCVMLVVSLDFLCMIMLLWFSNSTENEAIDFSPTRLIIYCIQICFVAYTIEAIFKWFTISSDEYWLNIWSAFDLLIVVVHWIGYILMLVWSKSEFYPQFCGILLIRMLKVVPYWNSLQLSLNVTASSTKQKLCKLIVILICSFSIILLKYAIDMVPSKSSQRKPFMNDSSANTIYLCVLLTHFSNFGLYFLCCAVIICVFIQAIDVLEVPPERQRVNASVSFLLNDSHLDELTNMLYQPRRSLNESVSPISIMSFPGGGASPMKFSPCNGSSNGLLAQETPTMLSPSSDVLSPFLSIPVSNGLNGLVQPPLDDNCHIAEDVNNVPTSEAEGNGRMKQCNSSFTELLMDLTSSGVIVLACINKVLGATENHGGNMSWDTLYPGRSLWLEILFILCITGHIVYKTRLSRFPRETFLQISCVCDLIVMLAATVEVFSSGMKWLPLKNAPKGVQVFVGCAKVITACRGLLLFSRISWLKCVGHKLCKMLGKAFPYLCSYGYIWLIFIISSSETQKMIVSVTGNKMDSPGNNNATSFGSVKSTDSITSLDVITPYSNAVVLIAIILFLLSFGGFLGLLFNRVGGWHGLIAKFNFVGPSTRSTNLGAYYSSTMDRFTKPTDGTCVPVLYFVTSHPNFDILMMTLIFLDGLVITLEYLATSERAVILRRHYPGYILFLYCLELGCKIGSNGLRFFKSNWNIFDTIVIGVSTADYILSLIAHNSFIPILILDIRFLRILRIFQFRPFIKRAQLIENFFSSVSKVYAFLRDFGIFYCSLFLMAIIFRLRCVQFIPTVHNPILWIAAPFQVLNAQSIYETIGNLKLVDLSVEYALFMCCLTLFSLIRISVIFCTWLILLAGLCHLLTLQNQHKNCGPNIITDINEPSLEGETEERATLDDKYFYLEPCASPETLDIETPSSSGTNRANKNNIASNPSCMTETEGTNTVQDTNPQNSSLYKTRTITSSEEINGCKVFYVELITTV